MKTKEKLKVALSLLLVTILSVAAFGGLVVAEDGGGDPTPTPTPLPPVTEICFVKQLVMDEALDLDASDEFVFKFRIQSESYSEQDQGTNEDVAIPLIGTPINEGMGQLEIKFDKDDVSDVNTETGHRIYTKTSGSLFEDVDWKSPGIYTYLIKETAGTVEFAAGSRKEIAYCYRSFRVKVYVKYLNDGAGPLGIENIVVFDATPGQGGKKVDASNTVENNKFIFYNFYTQQAGGDNPTSAAALKVSKKVSGEYASKEKYFQFNIQLTKAATEDDTHAYKAYLIDDDTGEVIKPVLANTNNHSAAMKDDSDRWYLSVSNTSTFSIKLKHGQSIAFTDMAVGVTFKASENPTNNYTGSIALKVNDDTVAVGPFAKGANASTGDQVLGAATNTADFTNTLDESTISPTGITTNDIPFIVLIALAVAGLAVFVVAKSRKRARSGN